MAQFPAGDSTVPVDADVHCRRNGTRTGASALRWDTPYPAMSVGFQLEKFAVVGFESGSVVEFSFCVLKQHRRKSTG
jgi:hypothetical protein